MEHQVHNYAEPGQKTPRIVKNLLIYAYSLYLLASIAFLIALFSTYWIAMTLAMAFMVSGCALQFVVVKFVHWYLTG